MKTLLIILVSTTLSLGAVAQRKGGYHHVYRPSRIIVSPSIGFGWGYGYPYYGYPYYTYPFGYPYGYPNPYVYRGTPYKLSLQIQSIKLDYKNQIRDARHNKTMSPSQRRQEIRRLKTERDQAIISAQQNFRYGNRNNRNNERYNSQDQGNNNQFQDNGQ